MKPFVLGPPTNFTGQIRAERVISGTEISLEK